nr:hypothetical protein WMHIBSEC_WMHIBSEC_CDS_0057 [Caudoviricetes sp.]CAI9751798.1 hypothetical protein AZFZUZMX_AZFZUZMX_CDS_0057 [Caudoviricetes sp.]
MKIRLARKIIKGNTPYWHRKRLEYIKACYCKTGDRRVNQAFFKIYRIKRHKKM